MDIKQQSLKLHKKCQGKICVMPVISLKCREDLCLAYTPGVAEVSRTITENPETVWDYTIKGHTVAVITDGSAVLGLGNIGALTAIPVMEGKALLFKALGGIDAFPICLNTQNTAEIITIVKALVPVFGGINLEDISAPRCFVIEDALQDLGIPVMHDDQHGTAVVVLAGLINALKVVGKKMKDVKVAISGAGAAGTAVAKLLASKVNDIIMVDSKGIIYKSRKDLDTHKKYLAQITNKEGKKGDLKKALRGVDVFIGVSKGGLLQAEDIKLMAKKAIVFAMANPIPEIMPDEAKKGGAEVIATGRSDYPNQINNVLAFPGIFRGALKVRATTITKEMKLAASQALADLVPTPSAQKLVPDPLDKRIVKAVSRAVSNAWKKS